MSVTAVPQEHFSGARAVTNAPGGADNRDLRTLLNQIIALANQNELDIAGLGSPLQLKGAIAVAADFPTSAAVETGWSYLISADVTDNDATKTNTGQSFKAGDEIAWNGTNWTRLGRNVTELKESDLQGAAATATVTKFIASAAGKINSVKALAGTAAAAGESMTVDVRINGVSCLTSAITIDDSSGTSVEDGAIDTAANTLAADDVVDIVRTYTAGGGPTPMADTLVSIGYEEAVG